MFFYFIFILKTHGTNTNIHTRNIDVLITLTEQEFKKEGKKSLDDLKKRGTGSALNRSKRLKEHLFLYVKNILSQKKEESVNEIIQDKAPYFSFIQEIQSIKNIKNDFLNYKEQNKIRKNNILNPNDLNILLEEIKEFTKKCKHLNKEIKEKICEGLNTEIKKRTSQAVREAVEKVFNEVKEYKTPQEKPLKIMNSVLHSLEKSNFGPPAYSGFGSRTLDHTPYLEHAIHNLAEIRFHISKNFYDIKKLGEEIKIIKKTDSLRDILFK